MNNVDFCSLRDRVIEKDFGKMNDMQFKAVTTTEGPLLVLAGAGSGKTTVLVNRIACLLKYGSAYKSSDVSYFDDDDISAAERFLNGGEYEYRNSYAVNAARPWEILAITFTNKAAGELKTRIAAMVGENSDVTAGTFHSVCGRILRRYADRIGYTSSFTIYDTDDQKRVMKDILGNLGIDEKVLTPRSVLSAVSSAKDKLIPPEEYAKEAGFDLRLKKIAEAYSAYQRTLKRADAMDFDDMIVNTVKLFDENPDVLDYYSTRFKYVMVDEYQDTNYAQYVLVKQLASKHKNICVVGDDDQSIYRFRGATIENILNFEGEYENSKVIRLEQNYRSTSHILDAANSVISHNIGRKGKTLWTDNGEGVPINVYIANDERGEANYVAEKILDSVKAGGNFSDSAILYRMNAQSRSFENIFARSGIPYRIIGGNRFFDRKEIKDVVSYLSVIANTSDEVRLKRIINEPKRGIGAATVETAAAVASGLGVPLYEVLRNAGDYPMLSRSADKLSKFCDMIDRFVDASANISIYELCENVLADTGYLDYLRSLGSAEADRVDNVYELLTSIKQYLDEDENASLTGYLEEVALISDIDSYDNEADAVVLMTVHSAKGLEFPEVYLVGMEEGIFPSSQTVFAAADEIEEERRLAYVAITRAKCKLHVIRAETRLIFGKTAYNLPSRFLEEIPSDLCCVVREKKPEFKFSGKPFAAPASYERKPVNFGYTPQKKPSGIRFAVGERVKHKVFGEGNIIAVTQMSTDQMLEIEFDTVGKKKLMANFAKLERI